MIAKINGEDFRLEVDEKTGNYILPRLEKGGRVYIDGQGEVIRLRSDSQGFITPILPNSSPLDATSTTYDIKNFTIVGGRSAIKLYATFNSTFKNLDLIGQSEYSIRAAFSLMSRFENIRITRPQGHGIWLGPGNDDWATNWNSQCNGSVLDQVRVDSAPTQVGNNFTILHSNGVQMLNCISEGWGNDGWAIYYNGLNSTVKQFRVDNFHVEHGRLPKKGGIYISAMANSPVKISQLFVQGWNDPNNPVVFIDNNASVLMEQIGWWVKNMKIHLKFHAPRFKTRDTHPSLNWDTLVYKNAQGVPSPIFKGYVHFDK